MEIRLPKNYRLSLWQGACPCGACQRDGEPSSGCAHPWHAMALRMAGGKSWTVCLACDKTFPAVTMEWAETLMKQRDHYRKLANGYREALAELAGSIPMDNYMRMVGSDHPLAQALAQANLVVHEGPQ